MDTDGDSQFDIEEWTRAVANVYHDELLNADGSAHELAAGAKKMHKAAPVAKSAAKPASSGAFEAVDPAVSWMPFSIQQYFLEELEGDEAKM